jgi:hypothetical protein
VAGVEVLVSSVVLAVLALLLRHLWRAAPGRRRRRRVQGPSWVRESPVGPDEAERRSMELLRSVINPDEWDQLQDLGFICVTGRRGRPGPRRALTLPRYRYLIYPHLPLVALLPRSMAPVREYCVQFPDLRAQTGGPLLPKGDDILAKWMTLRADEDRLLAYANVSNAGCQVPLGRVERDLARLERWEARRRPPARV